ncbi:D-galactonate dehydratase, partial [Streptomyces broussonetiae]
MKITRIETFLVPPRWLFCRVETDEGVVGWGEPVVEGRAEVVRAAVHVLAEH